MTNSGSIERADADLAVRVALHVGGRPRVGRPRPRRRRPACRRSTGSPSGRAAWPVAPASSRCCRRSVRRPSWSPSSHRWWWPSSRRSWPRWWSGRPSWSAAGSVVVAADGVLVLLVASRRRRPGRSRAPARRAAVRAVWMWLRRSHPCASPWVCVLAASPPDRRVVVTPVTGLRGGHPWVATTLEPTRAKSHDRRSICNVGRVARHREPARPARRDARRRPAGPRRPPTDETFGWDKEDGQGGAGRRAGRRVRAADAAVRREARCAARRAAGDGRRRQGRRAPHRADRPQPGRRQRSPRSACRASEERDHDYLWRIHQPTPGRGQIGVFNRSHYEDVLVVRVQELVPQPVWRRRYRHIRDFERMLVDEGTTVVKLFLHISKDEQRAAPAGPHRQPRRALEVPPRRPRRPSPVGRLHGGLPRRAARRRRPTTRRGTSCRPTASGCATSPSPRSCATTSSSIDPQFPRAGGGHRGPRRDLTAASLERARLTVCTVPRRWPYVVAVDLARGRGRHRPRIRTRWCWPAAPT